MYLRTIGRRFTKMIAYFLVMNSKRCISSPFCFKELQLPAENKWIWAKWPVWIRLIEKIAFIKRTTQACMFFSLSTLVLQTLYSSLQRQWNIRSYSIPVQTRLFSVNFSTRKTLLYGLNKFPFWVTMKQLAKQGCCKHL